jgi:phosphomannomutase
MGWFSNGIDKLLDWRVARRENLDGVKLYLGEEGWVMVRASGTENLLRVYAETSRIETTRQILDAVTERIRKF